MHPTDIGRCGSQPLHDSFSTAAFAVVIDKECTSALDDSNAIGLLQGNIAVVVRVRCGTSIAWQHNMSLSHA